MLQDFTRAAAQLFDPSLRRVLWRSLGASLLVCLAIAALAGLVLSAVTGTGDALLDSGLDFLGALAVFALMLVFFPTVSGLVASLYLDEVAEAVERRHYPSAPPARLLPAGQALGVGLRFLVWLLVWNLVALPLYLLLPGLNLLIFYGLHAILLGREYFEFAALRRMAPARLKEQRRATRLSRLVGGLLLALLASLPVLNLALPVLGAAAFAHLVARREAAGEKGGL